MRRWRDGDQGVGTTESEGRIRRGVATGALVALLAGLSAGVARADVGLYFPFDDGTATDVSGNGNHGILRGDPAVVEGILGQALLLDGDDDGVRVPDSPSLAFVEPHIEVWFYLEQPLHTSATLIQKGQGGVGYRVYVTDTGVVKFDVNDGSKEAVVMTSFRIQPGVWTPVVVKYDGSRLNLFVYGDLAASTLAPPVDVVTTSPISIGRSFVGRIDEIKVGDDHITPPVACEVSLKIFHDPSQLCLDKMLDVTTELGVEDTANRSFGATLVDIDQDGWIDLYYVNGAGNPPNVDPPPSGVCPNLPAEIEWFPGSANVLHMNNGDGTFGPDTAPAKRLDDKWNAMRHVWADYEHDGDRDVFSHNFIVSPFYVQIQGPPEMLFEDQRELTGLNPCLTAGTGASWVDLNNDGYLDMYAVEYDATRLAIEHVNILYLNDTQGGFVDVTAQSGLTLPDNPMGQVFGDYDNDGDQDVFVTNSHEVPARLYRNMGLDGQGIPQFVDVGPEAGVDVIGEPNRGIGADFGDYNNDGYLDLVFMREGDSRLFRNNGPNKSGVWTFTDVTNQDGLDFGTKLFWGGAFVDLNNDGWEDLVLANRSTGTNSVFINNGGTSWTEVAETLGMDIPGYPQMGVVPGDIDNDGDLDVVLVTWQLGLQNFLYRNEARGNNWIQFRLEGTKSNPEAVGARIEIESRLVPGGPEVRQIREIVAGVGFFSDHPRIQTFGVGKGDHVTATIRWPNGELQDLGELAINQRHDIKEPAIGPGE